jgi:sarcosine oxidase delta subunit
MSAAELNALEREVELTRGRFASDLARLRSPHNFAEFKEDLWAHARETKDGVLAGVKARWSGCCEHRRRKRTTPTPKISSTRKNGGHAPAALRMPQNKRSRIGVPRRARLRARPRRRLRRQPHQWRTAPLMRCMMPAIPRGIG